MDVDPTTGAATGAGAVLVTLVSVLARRGWRRFKAWLLSELALFIIAATESARRRDRKDEGRIRRDRKPGEVPITVDPEGETTDVFELVELERERQARRESGRHPVASRQRGGTRPPRPGTHHDRDEPDED